MCFGTDFVFFETYATVFSCSRDWFCCLWANLGVWIGTLSLDYSRSESVFLGADIGFFETWFDARRHWFCVFGTLLCAFGWHDIWFWAVSDSSALIFLFRSILSFSGLDFRHWFCFSGVIVQDGFLLSVIYYFNRFLCWLIPMLICRVLVPREVHQVLVFDSEAWVFYWGFQIGTDYTINIWV